MPDKFNHVHKQLLIHWTPGGEPREYAKSEDYSLTKLLLSQRQGYIAKLKSILQNGLFLSEPSGKHCDVIHRERDNSLVIRTSRPHLCFTELDPVSCISHARRYGLLGLGFTKKSIVRAGGSPLIYLSNSQNNFLRKALVRLIKNSKGRGLEEDITYFESFLKLFKPVKEAAGRDHGKSNRPSKGKRYRISKEADPSASPYKREFGGILQHVEEKEWRIVQRKNNDAYSASVEDPSDGGLYFNRAVSKVCLVPDLGKGLCSIYFPDHVTLSMALDDDEIMNRVRGHGKRPAISMLSIEEFSIW